MGKIISRHLYFFYVLAFINLLYCAKQLPPPGGPVDKKAPEIVDTFPEPNSTNIPLETDIEIVFSERVKKSSVLNSIYISPRPPKTIAYKMKGRRLVIDFADSLRQNKTYVLTIGSEVEDLRRNKMKKSFHLAFSTGDILDKGRISGHVYDDAGSRGMLVAAYSLQNKPAPDPGKDVAEYLTQCDEMGGYQFSYISPGSYRLYTFRDKNADNIYDRVFESIGIPTTDVHLTNQNLSFEKLNFKITKEDTIPPIIKMLRVIDKFHIDIRFNEDIEKLKDVDGTFKILEKDNESKELRLRNVIHNSYDGSQFNLSMMDEMAEIGYILSIDTLYDKFGNLIDSTYRTYEFEGSAIEDTIKPRLVYQYPADAAKNVALDIDLRFVFSEAMKHEAFENNFSLKDSSGQHYEGEFNWKSSLDVTFTPSEDLKEETDYIASARVDSLHDEYGNMLADTLLAVRFKTLNKDTLSSILGRIDDLRTDGGGKIYMEANQVSQQDGMTYEILLNNPGSYTFSDIFPGVYLINGFRDENGDGKYTYGNVCPYIPSERFFYYPDSIKIRSKWPNEGNDIIMNSY